MACEKELFVVLSGRSGNIVDTRTPPPYPLAHMNHNAPGYAYYYGYFT